MAYIIGIDTGGTKISIVLARQSGKILEKQLLRTKLHGAAQSSINEILQVIKTLIEKHGVGKQLAAIGVGMPGAIDTHKGIITRSPNLPGWAGIPIRKILRHAFHVPIFLDNDANVACLGEKFFGAGKSFQNFIYITVSTGIGGGVVANGRLVRGIGGYAGEIGHIVVHPHGRDCNCGKQGCLEAYASGTAMAKIAQEKIKRLSRSQRKKSRLARCLEEREGKISAANIALAARAGDSLARDIFDEAGHDLGLGLSTVIHVLNPEAIILGGSVTKAYPLFRKAMTKALKENVWSVPLKNCKILPSKLGDQVADLGTIALVKENMRL
jgi:glucokinase